MTVLTTERLVLRPFEPSDAPVVQELCSAREIAATTLLIPHPYRLEDAEAFIRSIESGTEFAVTLAAGTLVGAVALRVEPENSRAELGYWIGVPFWGNGYATEASRAVLDHGFGALGLNRIFALCFAENVGSRRVLERLGMRHEGTLRGHTLKWGDFRDDEAFGILASDWLG
ncbi:MAG TPA: GNAT family N-acetyltransferase [Gaiellaceae bacterium]|nr:GNAT family N-acetyltransferase [Gaiellaceae bacterium]